MIVVKIGGSIAERCDGLLDELADRHAHGQELVLVHGFGPQTTALAEARGIEQRFVTSPTGVTSRFTDKPVLEVLVDAGTQVGAGLLQRLTKRDVGAAHILGHEAPVFQASAKVALRDTTEDGRTLIVRGNRSGTVSHVDAAPVRSVLDAGDVPVVTPIGVDAAGPVSVDGDRAAASLAASLGADALVLLTDVAGYLERFPDPSSRVERLSAAGIDALIGSGATGGMVKKLVACRTAAEGGVPKAVLADGTVEGPIARALAGDGTEVVP